VGFSPFEAEKFLKDQELCETNQSEVRTGGGRAVLSISNYQYCEIFHQPCRTLLFSLMSLLAVALLVVSK
jgi:hypothetical protein